MSMITTSTGRTWLRLRYIGEETGYRKLSKTFGSTPKIGRDDTRPPPSSTSTYQTVHASGHPSFNLRPTNAHRVILASGSHSSNSGPLSNAEAVTILTKICQKSMDSIEAKLNINSAFQSLIKYGFDGRLSTEYREDVIKFLINHWPDDVDISNFNNQEYAAYAVLSLTAYILMGRPEEAFEMIKNTVTNAQSDLEKDDVGLSVFLTSLHHHLQLVPVSLMPDKFKISVDTFIQSTQTKAKKYFS